MKSSELYAPIELTHLGHNTREWQHRNANQVLMPTPPSPKGISRYTKSQKNQRVLFLLLFSIAWSIQNISKSLISDGADLTEHDFNEPVVRQRQAERERNLQGYSTLSSQNNDSRNNQKNTTRVLMGIFCQERDEEYRQVFRLLFSLHPSVCSLGRYQRGKHTDSQCQLIYTFVTGGNNDSNAPTELLDDSIPILLQKSDDQVTLNIKENLNDGKSQTWFYFATTLIKNEGFHFDYVGKMDTDTLIRLDDYFEFAEENLHPYPFNVRKMAGRFYEKSWWPKINKKKEQFFESYYPGFTPDAMTGMHLYPGGQLYILSTDLVANIVQDAKPFSSYNTSEGVEDHDIGTMAYVQSQGKPMNPIMLSSKQQFWDHPVKRTKRQNFIKMWRNEISRARTLFLPQNSTTPQAIEEFLSTTATFLAEKTKNGQISFLKKLDLGWSSDPPEWMRDLCPDVVTHFNRFPSFKEREPRSLKNLPLFPTNDAAQAVCTIKVVQVVAASINARVYLHAGSHLGAVVHGQPIPWDDDVDLIMNHRYIHDLQNICQGEGVQVHASGVKLRCSRAFNSLKIWLHPQGHKKMNRVKDEYFSPYVDLFAFEIDDGNVKEVFLDANSTLKPDQVYSITDYFPTRPYYFAGIHVLGPQSKIPESRYNFDACTMGGWNHRIERYVGHRLQSFGAELDCNFLSTRFPFRNLSTDTISINSGNTNQDELKIFPWKAAAPTTNSTWTSIATSDDRNTWRKLDSEPKGQDLTDSLKINEVEIDNSISLHESCTGPLKVTELNAERGRWWMEYSKLLGDSDVIILNEMDIGMARSDNQHTTRLLAHHLGMNYAWGLEFIELTPGDKNDRENGLQIPDFHGLHGNAFLTKCSISDAVIFRNRIGPYFDSKPNKVNANGFEKRLGGRMGMFGKIVVDGKETVIGSLHKLEEFHTEIKTYIGERNAIVAGDQDNRYCNSIGLENIVSGRGMKTWPASCSGFGRIRGDNIICSNMKAEVNETTILPCVEEFGFQVNLGDHALTTAVLSVEDGLERID